MSETTNETGKTVKEKTAEKPGITVSVMGVGQGGTSMAAAIAAQFRTSKVGLVNMSIQDAESVGDAIPESNRIILAGGGAGKDRTNSKNALMKHLEHIEELASKLLKSTDILLVPFSTSGGTGSGIGPLLVSYFNSEEFLTNAGGLHKKVIGVALLPSDHEGIRSVSNTVEALEDVNTVIKSARFMLIDGNFHPSRNPSDAYPAINSAVAGIIHRHLTVFGNSRLSCLDKRDRLNGFDIPGIHSLYVFEKGGKIETPFVLPRGSKALQLLCEIGEDRAEDMEKTLQEMGIFVDDKIIGMFEPGVNSSNVVHLAGTNNLTKVAEFYRSRLSQIKSISKNVERNDASGKGFHGLKDETSAIKGEYKAERIGGKKALAALLGANDGSMDDIPD